MRRSRDDEDEDEVKLKIQGSIARCALRSLHVSTLWKARMDSEAALARKEQPGPASALECTLLVPVPVPVSVLVPALLVSV